MTDKTETKPKEIIGEGKNDLANPASLARSRPIWKSLLKARLAVIGIIILLVAIPILVLRTRWVKVESRA